MSSPLTGTIAEIAGGNGKQVLRLRKMAVLMANEDDPAVTSIVDATNGDTLSIPNVYKTVGYLGKDEGATLTPGREVSDSTAFGQVQPINQYVDSTSFAAGFTMKETNRTTLEGYYGLDLSAIRASATTGEIKFDMPDQPPVQYKRLLLIGQHGEGADAIWVGQFLPKASLSDIGDQTISDTDDFVYPVTYTALVDDVLGTSQRVFIAGPGLANLGSTPFGFQVASGA